MISFIHQNTIFSTQNTSNASTDIHIESAQENVNLHNLFNPSASQPKIKTPSLLYAKSSIDSLPIMQSSKYLTSQEKTFKSQIKKASVNDSVAKAKAESEFEFEFKTETETTTGTKTTIAGHFLTTKEKKLRLLKADESIEKNIDKRRHGIRLAKEESQIEVAIEGEEITDNRRHGIRLPKFVE
jgi:hypothetical protein